MKTNEGTPHGKDAIACAIAIVVRRVKAALAAVRSTSANLASAHPMISGHWSW